MAQFNLSDLKNKLSGKLSEGLPPETSAQLRQQMSEGFGAAHTALAPLFEGASRAFKQLMASSTTTTLGSTFRNICIVGLNRTELLLGGEGQSIFADNWQELVDESMRRHLSLVFFAPRGFDGEPVNPYMFLAGEQIGAEVGEGVDASALALAQQLIGTLPLLDFCRMSPAAPNTLNMVIAADVLFHWDVKDNYILTTSPSTWARDVEQVLKGYPRTTRANIYTQWDKDLLPPSDRITVSPLRDLPLDPATWINKPTLQEAYANQILGLGIAVSVATAGLLYWKQQDLSNLNEELRVIEQQIPREGRFLELERAVGEQEQMMQKREIFYLAVKDIARSLQTSQMKVANFEVRAPDAQTVPKQYLITVEAARDAYNGWLQEEPIAKSVLVNSALLEAVRKQPGNTYKLEGLITIDRVWKEYQKLASNRRLETPVSGTAKSADAKSAEEQP